MKGVERETCSSGECEERTEADEDKGWGVKATMGAALL